MCARAFFGTSVDGDGLLTVWSATQVPHIVRFALAATTGVPESKIRVIAPDVGGGFGGKLFLRSVTQADQGVDFDFLRAATMVGKTPR